MNLFAQIYGSDTDPEPTGLSLAETLAEIKRLDLCHSLRAECLKVWHPNHPERSRPYKVENDRVHVLELDMENNPVVTGEDVAEMLEACREDGDDRDDVTEAQEGGFR